MRIQLLRALALTVLEASRLAYTLPCLAIRPFALRPQPLPGILGRRNQNDQASTVCLPQSRRHTLPVRGNTASGPSAAAAPRSRRKSTAFRNTLSADKLLVSITRSAELRACPSRFNSVLRQSSSQLTSGRLSPWAARSASRNISHLGGRIRCHMSCTWLCSWATGRAL